MSTTLLRAPLTDILLTQLRTLGKPIGDGVFPAGASWIGQPNLPGSVFEPFGVLSALNAGESSGPIGDSQANWQVPYMLESFGVLRDQCDWMAGETRHLLEALRYQTYALGPASYKIQQFRSDLIAASVRIDVTDPAFWHIEDKFTVWLGKVRS